ncbi:hypothetical protein C2G38_2176712 [Gigaspora rosea]|uniref:DUF6570 domain-containing protein n=1 Tax=Gigaspora rosea TaxID=44941 RepID=A0A397VG10_9GLOM|nr:hypothetical protein C2G38_2176712 [Gigaspora rosea]
MTLSKLKSEMLTSEATSVELVLTPLIRIIGEILNEFPQLSQVEEMLIAQVILIFTFHKLQGGQLGYRENVINFSKVSKSLLQNYLKTFHN